MEKPFGETIVPHQSPVEVIFGRGATPMSSPAFRYPAHDQSPLMIMPGIPVLEQEVRDFIVRLVRNDPVAVAEVS